MNVARLPEQVKDKITADSFALSTAEPLSHRNKGAITGHLNEAFGGDSGRHLALAWLFDHLGLVTPSDPDTYITGMSTKSLSEGDWWALQQWIGAYKDPETGEWSPRLEFPLEASLVLNEAIKAYSALPVDRKKEDQSWVNTMLAHSVALGGVITAVEKPDGTYPDNSNVELPAEITRPPEKKRMFDTAPEVDF